MKQQGQVFELKTRSHGGEAVWAYRYRIAGRDSRRLQRGGFKSERAAREALERALARLRREQGLVEAPRLRELVDLYLAQHGGEPETVAKLRWLLTKAVRAFGHRRINQLRPAEILDLDAVRPKLLSGDAPEGIWDALANQAMAAGFEVVRNRGG